MSRYGNKEAVELYAGNEQLLNYRITPGIEVDNFGRDVFYDNYFSSGVYVWSHHAVNKIKCKCHHGAAPFIYAKSLLDTSDTPEPSGILTVLPKPDVATELDVESFEVDPDNKYLSFPSFTGYWVQAGIPREQLKVIDYEPENPLWQYKLADLLIQYDRIRVPTFSTLMISAIHSGVDVEVYEGDQYLKPNDERIVKTCAFSGMPKVAQEFVKAIPSIIQDDKDRLALVSYFFSVDKIQSPSELLTSLFNLNAVNRYSYSIEDINQNYYPKTHSTYREASHEERMNAYERLKELTFVKPSRSLEKLVSQI